MDVETGSTNTSLDDKTEDFCENPTRDTLAEGLMCILKPTIDQLDERVKVTRISQLELKQQIEGLAEELKIISDEQTWPFALEEYTNKLTNARQKITVVSNILQAAQFLVGHGGYRSHLLGFGLDYTYLCLDCDEEESPYHVHLCYPWFGGKREEMLDALGLEDVFRPEDMQVQHEIDELMIAFRDLMEIKDRILRNMYDHSEVEHAATDLSNTILRARRRAMLLAARFDAPPPPSSPSNHHQQEVAESDGSATDFNPNTDDDDNNNNNNDDQPPDNELHIIQEIVDVESDNNEHSTNHRVQRGHQCRRRRIRVCRRREVTDVDSSSTPRPRRPHCSTLNRVLQQVVNANPSQSDEVDDGNPTTDRCPICLTESVTVELSGCGHRYCVDYKEMKLKTPDWKLEGVENEVYEPSEDTFLLLDVLESELEWLKNKNPTVIVEVGSGSGVIITALSNALGNSTHCIATDINFSACVTTCKTSTYNNAQVDVLETDLTQGLKDGVVDILVFNPPYVLTEPDEISGRGLQRAWAGGCKGRQVMDRLFPLLPTLLSSNACFYLVVIEENCPEEISSVMLDLGFESSVLQSRKVRGEQLSVMKFIRI
ncbi:uncharacterized protein LOC142318557 [Lycorma delicatula]|uniref:uncharacterized protein LOC142318557 n=1 Tax=Lycorma delicatula TaxID=130591 RepID=UPI003F5179B1